MFSEVTAVYSTPEGYTTSAAPQNSSFALAVSSVRAAGLRSAWLMLGKAGERSLNHDHTEVKVLLVDDETSCRSATAMLLEHLGCSVDAVASGEEALAHFDPRLHQLVITDLLMPGISGEDVAAEIKRRSSTTPVLVYTGTTISELRGVEAVIAKPGSIDDFRKALAAVGGSSRPSEEKPRESAQRPRLSKAAIRTTPQRTRHRPVPRPYPAVPEPRPGGRL
jgi:CheY-like chemotaxis protein